MITPVTMHDSVCEFLKSEVADRYTLKAEDRNGELTYRNPQVIRSGRILPKSIDADNNIDEEFPFIIPRIWKVENVPNERVSVVTLLVLFGVFDPGVYEDGALVDDGSGYRDLWNLIESTRQAFFTNQTIDNKYRVIDDHFEAEMIPEDTQPYWEGYCKTKWHVAFPLPNLDETFF